MNMTPFEPMLRNATIKAIDSISRKIGDAEDAAESGVNRLLRQWKAMDETEKEHVVGVVIATATTVVTALAALKGRRKKSPVKEAGNAVLKKVAKKLG